MPELAFLPGRRDVKAKSFIGTNTHECGSEEFMQTGFEGYNDRMGKGGLVTPNQATGSVFVKHRPGGAWEQLHKALCS